MDNVKVLIEQINELKENIIDDFVKLKEQFSSNEEVEKILLKEIRGNKRYDRDLEKAVTLNK